MSYVETQADAAFTWFLQTLVPADFSATEFALFRYHEIRRVP